MAHHDDRDRLDELVAGLKAGKSFEELGYLHQPPEPPPGELEVRRRIALVSTFDPVLYDEVLGRDLPGDIKAPDFDALVKSPEFERVPRAKRTYRLKRMAQAPLLAAWSLDDRQRFSDTLAKFYGARTPVDELEQLSHAIVASPEKARPRFEALYDQADAAFDLPRCDRLLRIVQTRADEDLLDAPFIAALTERAQLFAARNLFADEYSRSASFYGRDTEREQFRKFLDDSKHYIFHLFGQGGFGKTMLLRHLVSRELIARPRRLPVARVDFDLIRLAALDTHAWLVLVPIAEQLLAQKVVESQLTGLLSDVQEYAAYLRRPLANEDTDYLTALGKRLDDESNDLEKKTVSILGSALNSLSRPVVIVLDTVEELSLHRLQSLIALLNCLAKVHKDCQLLRVVLSGRHDLTDSEKVPAYEPYQAFVADTVCAPLAAFTETEGIGYLKNGRGLEDRHPLLAMYRKSGGNPFNLALLADLAASRESLTEEDVNRYPDADLAYLVDRILDRIPKEDDPLPWVLRYGIVPRDLTKSFLKEVIEPLLPIVSKGESTLDRANEQLPDGAAPNRQGQVWEPVGAKETDEHWSTLTKYASAQSWVDMPTADKELVHFQPELVKPMRRLLAKQDIFPILQEKAAEYFEKLAERDRGQWSYWMSQAIYHRFEHEGPAAIERWRTQLGRAVEFGMKARQDIAEILLDNVFRDDDGDIRWWKDRDIPLVSTDARAEAHFEVAALAAQEALRLPDGSDEQRRAWTRAKDHLDDTGSDFEDERSGRRLALRLNIRYERYALVNGAILMANQAYQQAVSFLDAAIEQVTAPQYLVALDLQVASALAELNEPRCVDHLIRARDRARLLDAPYLPVATISRKIGQWYADHDDYGRGILEYQGALKSLTDSSDPLEAGHIVVALGEMLRASTLLDDARQVFEGGLTLEALKQDPTTTEQIKCSLARTLLDRGEPFQAAKWLANSPPEPAKSVLAAQQEARGAIQMELLDFKGANDLLQQAANLWREARFERRAADVRTLLFKLWFDKVGDLRQAGLYADARDQTVESTDPTLDVAMALNAIRWYMAVDDRQAAIKRWSALMSHEGVRKSLRLSCLALATGLAFGISRGESDLRDYLALLARISPPAGRYGFLRLFRFAETGAVGATTALSTRLRECLTLEDRTGPDAAQRALIVCDAYRAFGMKEQAAELLEQTIGSLRENRQWLLLQEAARLWDRLGDWRGMEPVDAERFVQEFANYPTLGAVLQLEQGERAWRRGGNPREIEVSLQASSSLREKARDTHWCARWHALSARVDEANNRPLREVATKRHTATETYLRLGDRVRASALEKSFTRPAPSSADTEPRRTRESASVPAVGTETVHDIVITSQGREALAVTVTLGTSERPPRPEYRARHIVNADEESLVALLTDERLEYSFRAVNQMARTPEAFTNGLGRLLLTSSEQEQLGTRAPARVQLRTDSALQAVPWELASFGEGPLTRARGVTTVTRDQLRLGRVNDAERWVQEALNVFGVGPVSVDGLLNPETLLALEKFKRDAGLPATPELDADTIETLRRAKVSVRTRRRPAVVVLKGSGTAERARRWGYGTIGTSLRQLYRGTGGNERVRSIILSPVPAFDKLTHELVEASADVVHIFSGFQETTTRGGTEVHLDFGEESIRGLTASALGTVLRPLGGDRVRPVIVLEGAFVADPLETLRQLFLRNIFAAQLYAIGSARAVLATGLIGPDRLGAFGPHLVSSLIEAPHLTEIARSLCHFDAAFAAATALFATEPRLPALG